MRTIVCLIGLISSVSCVIDIQDALDEIVEENKIIGVSIGGLNVSPDDLVPDWGIRGQSGRRVAEDDSPPIGHDDKFFLGAASKAITAVLAARVVESGEIHWNSTVKEVLFDSGEILPTMTIHFDDTLMDLMLYKANLPESSVSYYESNMMDEIDRHFVQSNFGLGNNNTDIRKSVAQWIFNVDWSYPDQPEVRESDISTTMAVYMMEVATGKDFETLLLEEVFTPLNMLGCGVGPPTVSDELPPSQPWSHQCGPWGVYNYPVTPSNTAYYSSFLAPANGIHCDFESVKSFLAANLMQDNILSAESWSLILEKQVSVVGGGDYYELTLGWTKRLTNIDGMNINLLYGMEDEGNSVSALLLTPDTNGGLVIAANSNMAEGMRQNVGYDAILEGLFSFVTNGEWRQQKENGFSIKQHLY